MNPKVIYTDESGLVSISEVVDLKFPGATQADRIHAWATKRLPAGTEYEIIDPSELPASRVFRDAWTYTPGPNSRRAGE